MLHDAASPGIPQHLWVAGSLANARRHVLGNLEAIPLDPRVHPIEHRRRLAASAGTTPIVRDGRVELAVELDNGDGVAGRVARRQRVVGGAQDVVVKGARDGGEGGDLGRRGGIAGEQTNEAAAVGFARCVDARRVDAVGRGQVVDEVGCEGDVGDVGWRIWVACPLPSAFGVL